MTMTTIGHGIMAPTTDIGKLFTVFFAFISIGTFLFVATNIINNYVQKTYDEFFVIKDLFKRGHKNHQKKKIRVIVEKE